MKKSLLIILFLPSICFGFNPFQDLTSSGELANVSPWTSQSASAGTANFGPTGSHTSVEWIGVGHLYRIRQNGTIRQSKIYVASTADISEFYLKIWRYNGSTYDLVGTSENLSSQLIVGVSTLTLSTGIVAQEGDYVGARVVYDGAIAAQNFFSADATSASAGYDTYPTQYEDDPVNTFSITDEIAATSGHDWDSETALADKIVIQECYMDAPVFVSLGDSITSGSAGASAFTTTNASFIDILQPTTHIEYSYPYHLATALGYTRQNMGIGGDSVSNMVTRFAQDVAALHPRFMVFLGGVNDINGGASAATVSSNVESILSSCRTAGIIPVVVGVLPEAPHANITAWRAIDSLNALLSSLATSYGGIYIDPSPMGQFYVGGDDGNLWQLKPEYKCAADNVHLSTTGYAALASIIYDGIQATDFPEAQYPILPEQATGGTITTSGVYTIHTFTTSGTFVVPQGGTVECLIVGGGAGAGAWWGGGGGGGEVYFGTMTITAGSHSVSIGTGSAGGDKTIDPYYGLNGSDSSFNSVVALGGGFGGYAVNGGDCGNGGGGGTTGAIALDGGLAIGSYFGFPGGNGGYTAWGYPGGGGGGATAAGTNASSGYAGNGGEGYTSDITGTSQVYGSGGGGGIRTGTAGTGGTNAGNGNNNGDGGDATDGFGGGGGGPGGTSGGNGGDGGNGVVILRYIQGTSSTPFSISGSTSTVNVSIDSKTSTGTETGTLTNAPVSGNPTGWHHYKLNGVEVVSPYWNAPE